MVHGRDHRDDDFAVGEAQDRDFGTGQELFDDDFGTGGAELAVEHHFLDSVHRLFPRLRDDDAFAEGQTVGLDDRRDGSGFQICERLVAVFKDFVRGGRDVVLLHEVLREDLGTLDDGSLGLRAEARDADGFEFVDTAENERIVHRHDGEVDGVLFAELYDSGNVGGADAGAHRVICHAAVAGQSVDDFHVLVFIELFDDGMLSSAATNDH